MVLRKLTSPASSCTYEQMHALHGRCSSKRVSRSPESIVVTCHWNSIWIRFFPFGPLKLCSFSDPKKRLDFLAFFGSGGLLFLYSLSAKGCLPLDTNGFSVVYVKSTGSKVMAKVACCCYVGGVVSFQDEKMEKLSWRPYIIKVDSRRLRFCCVERGNCISPDDGYEMKGSQIELSCQFFLRNGQFW